MTSFRSTILTGHVMHRRQRPVSHAFRYPVCYFLFDVDELPHLDRGLTGFGYNRWRPAALFDSDYGRPPVRPLRESIERFLRSNGLDQPLGRIELLTQARTLGYVFNPVSYFYCFAPHGKLVCTVAEVNNTYGDRIRNLLSDDKLISGRLGRCCLQPKQMHVSPFMPMPPEYHWYFWREGDRLAVHMDETASGERFFEARLWGRLEPLTPTSLCRGIARFPLMPVQIMAKIHWQALRLYFNGAPYFPRPPFREDGAAQSGTITGGELTNETNHELMGVGV